MINEVRQIVLSILNKNNFGVISVSDFNGYARLAQLKIFEDTFNRYNKQVNLENARLSGTDYAGLSKILAETLEIFSVSNFLSNSSNVFTLPDLLTTGDQYYNIGKILCYPTQLANSNNTSIVSGQLVDSTANFISAGVAVGDIVANILQGTAATVTSVTSATVLVLSANIFGSTPLSYRIYDVSEVRIAEKVSQGKITELSISLLTAPNSLFPAYSQQANSITVLPSTISNYGMVQAQYYRYPLDPKWTYVSITGGEPVFDQSQSDYQDFELPKDYEFELVAEILKMCGIQIRESDVYQYANQEEMKEKQQ